ncbi:hypothetical protein L1987_38784 [Smallanthus sonchifolius]|uniref:Uncharacterized protein n=1 Tax=Smallanthus sonchifolius TaxID=185202 RepID=A0ACB9HLI4_9ASTR|nr:hypothetical protein L1987_38784 [Smallanthus sonchifolius]
MGALTRKGALQSFAHRFKTLSSNKTFFLIGVSDFLCLCARVQSKRRPVEHHQSPINSSCANDSPLLCVEPSYFSLYPNPKSVNPSIKFVLKDSKSGSFYLRSKMKFQLRIVRSMKLVWREANFFKSLS